MYKALIYPMGVPLLRKKFNTKGKKEQELLSQKNSSGEDLNWWRYGDSNPRPTHCERVALPTELYPHAQRTYFNLFGYLCQGLFNNPI